MLQKIETRRTTIKWLRNGLKGYAKKGKNPSKVGVLAPLTSFF